MNPVFTDTIRLGFSHANMIGSLPAKAVVANRSNLPQILKDIREKDIKMNPVKNGMWWESSDCDFAKYFPEVDPTGDPDQFSNPAETEFVYPVFRAISEVLLHAGRFNWNLDLFTEPGVLRASIPLLIGQAIYPDHKNDLGKELGVVLDAFYEDSYSISLENGETLVVPAGINVVMKIDVKSNPEIARRIMMDPPSIHSCSTTFMFNWRPSHDLEETDGDGIEDFFYKLGTMAPDGQLYRRICTEVIAYQELSLVPHGADSFAKKINQETGEITLPQHVQKMAQLLQNSTPVLEPTDFYEYSYKKLTSQEPLKAALEENKAPELNSAEALLKSANTDTTPKTTSNNHSNPKTSMPQPQNGVLDSQQMIRLGVILNLDESDATDPQQLSNAIEKLAAAHRSYQEELTDLRKLKTDLTSENNIMKEKVDKLEPKAQVGEQAMTSLRNRVLHLYHKLHNKPDTAMLALINQADFAGLQSFEKDYSEKMDNKFAGYCNNCGSHDVTRASAHYSGSQEESELANQKLQNRTKTNEELLAESRNTTGKPRWADDQK